MHHLVLMQSLNPLAHLSENSLDLPLVQAICLDVPMKGPSSRILQDHEGGVLALVVEVVDELDDPRVVELLVKGDLLLGILPINLDQQTGTSLMATFCLVRAFLASFTSP